VLFQKALEILEQPDVVRESLAKAIMGANHLRSVSSNEPTIRSIGETNTVEPQPQTQSISSVVNTPSDASSLIQLAVKSLR
jgi:hypothetical protein